MKKKKDIDTEAFLADENDNYESDRNDSGEGRRIRRVSPLGLRVLVAIRKEGNQTESGLYLPEGAKSNMQESVLAEVLEVASATDSRSGLETNISGIPMGAIVLISKEAGIKLPWDEYKRLVDTKDILAIVSELSLV